MERINFLIVFDLSDFVRADRTTANRYTLWPGVLVSNSFGRFTAIWFGRQHWNRSVSYICSRAASNQCGRIRVMQKAENGWFDCAKIGSIVPGKMPVWLCWVNSFWLVQRSVVSSWPRGFHCKRICCVFGIERPPIRRAYRVYAIRWDAFWICRPTRRWSTKLIAIVLNM